MGVSGLVQSLKRLYPNAFMVPRYPLSYDWVYVDINPQVHKIARRSSTEKNIQRELFQSLLSLTRSRIHPQKGVYLAVDGTPPLIKLKEQRKRRKGSENKKGFNRAQITCGTTFMTNIDHLLGYIACSRLLLDKRKVLKVMVDSSCSHGEAEWKMQEHIVNRMWNNDSDSTLLVSNDSDTIVQAFISGTFHTSILLEDDALFKPNLIYDKMKQQLPTHDTNRVMKDLGFLIFFTGNDYIEKVKRSSLEKLWGQYLTLMKIEKIYIVNEKVDSINVHQLKKLLDSFDTFSSHGILQLSEEEKTKMGIYFQTIMWNLVTYHTGKCPNYYHRDEYCSPTFTILVGYLAYLHASSVTEIKYDYGSVGDRLPLTPSIFSSLVTSTEHLTDHDLNQGFKQDLIFADELSRKLDVLISENPSLKEIVTVGRKLYCGKHGYLFDAYTVKLASDSRGREFVPLTPEFKKFPKSLPFHERFVIQTHPISMAQ